MPSSKAKKRRGLEFVDMELAQQYICSICFSAMQNPADIGCKKQHLFCKDCILSHLEHDSSCPQCKEKCFGDGVKTMPFVRKQINALHIRCPNHRLTAKKRELLNGSTGKTSNLKRSATMPVSRRSSKVSAKRAQRSGSQYSKLDETEEGCSWTGTLADFESGKHPCDLDMITCPKCRKRVLKRHLKTPCADCKQTYVGCQRHVCATNTCACGFMKNSPIFAMF